MKLGKNQASFLDAVKRFGGFPGYGFCWNNRSSGRRLAESLEAKGLLQRTTNSLGHTVWVLSKGDSK